MEGRLIASLPPYVFVFKIKKNIFSSDNLAGVMVTAWLNYSPIMTTIASFFY